MMSPPIHVLLVEDNADQALSLATELTLRPETTFSIETVGTLAAAVKRLAAGGIDVVLLDLGLPDAPNPSLTVERVCKAGDAEVIVYTGRDGVELEAKAAGASEVVRKPADSAELSCRIQFTVVRRRSERQRNELHNILKQIGTLLEQIQENGPC